MKKTLTTLLLSISLNLFSAESTSFRGFEEHDQSAIPFACRTIGETVDDEKLVKRIISAYQLADKKHLGNSMWQMFFDQKHQEIHRQFHEGNFNTCTKILRKPSETDLFYGIDSNCISVIPKKITAPFLIETATAALDRLIRLGEATAAIRLYNPEAPTASRKITANEALALIENKLGFALDFPNPHPDEIGVYTYRGIASYRAIQAIYQAYLIKELTKDIENPKVLEIGAGVGRTAYYANKFGIYDYTIVDIPITILSSSYFLGRTLGEDKISLLGEAKHTSQVKIIGVDEFLNGSEHYDLIINADSLTEMSYETMQIYRDKIESCSSIFISINHDCNTHTVTDLFETASYKTKIRKPYWMRKGYIEEVFYFNN